MSRFVCGLRLPPGRLYSQSAHAPAARRMKRPVVLGDPLRRAPIRRRRRRRRPEEGRRRRSRTCAGRPSPCAAAPRPGPRVPRSHHRCGPQRISWDGRQRMMRVHQVRRASNGVGRAEKSKSTGVASEQPGRDGDGETRHLWLPGKVTLGERKSALGERVASVHE